MLYLPPATAKLIRAQGSFVSDDEIRRIVEYVKNARKPDYDDELVGWEAGGGTLPSLGGGESDERDPLYDAGRRGHRREPARLASASSSAASRSVTRARRALSI